MLPTSPNFTPLKEMSIEEGESYAVVCFSFGYKINSPYKDLIEWKKDGLPVSYNVAKGLENARVDDENYDSFKLHLKQVNKSYDGTYTCHRFFSGCAQSQKTQSSIRVKYIGKNKGFFVKFSVNSFIQYLHNVIIESKFHNKISLKSAIKFLFFIFQIDKLF